KKQGKKGYLQTKKHSFLNETIPYVDKITTQDTDDFYHSKPLYGASSYFDREGNPLPEKPSSPGEINIQSHPITHIPQRINANIEREQGLVPLTNTNKSNKDESKEEDKFTVIKRKEYEPTDLPFSQIVPELLALGMNSPEGVQGQKYTPRLYQPYQVSFQDRRNELTSDLRGL